MFKGTEITSKKMKCAIVNVCLEGTVGLIEFHSVGSGGFSSGHPESPKERGGQLRFQPATDRAIVGKKGTGEMSTICGRGRRAGVLLSLGAVSS